jgi:hypothetical protein
MPIILPSVFLSKFLTFITILILIARIMPRWIIQIYRAVVNVGVAIPGLGVGGLWYDGIWLNETSQQGIIPPGAIVKQLNVTVVPLISISNWWPMAAGKCNWPQ